MNKFLKLSYEQRINMGKMGRNYMIKNLIRRKLSMKQLNHYLVKKICFAKYVIEKRDSVASE